MTDTQAPAVEMQELFCECGNGCGKMVTMPVDKFLEVIHSDDFQVIVAIDCPTPPLPTDKEVMRGDNYIVYKTG